MGDHQNGSSRSVMSGMDLHDLIKSSPEDFLGKSVLDKFKDIQLPFLFKILSFDKALPLQSHPDRKLGEQLMKQEKKESWLGKNETFVDPNHKPEVAVVLSETFQGFVGFRPIEEIQQFVRDIPELREAIGETNAQQFTALQPREAEQNLKSTFGKIFDDEDKKGSQLVDSFMSRVKKEGNKIFGRETEEYLAEVAQKLYTQYPGDIGIFGALFFSNLVVLHKGQGIAIQPNVIHAYVEGDVIEVSPPTLGITVLINSVWQGQIICLLMDLWLRWVLRRKMRLYSCPICFLNQDVHRVWNWNTSLGRDGHNRRILNFMTYRWRSLTCCI